MSAPMDLSGNRIEGFIPPMMCLTGDINGNGENGDFACDVVSCQRGTWSPIGRATHKTSRFVEEEDRYECQPCPGAKYLGTKTCPAVNVIVGSFSESSGNTDGIIAGLVVAALLLCCTSGIVGARLSQFLSQKTAVGGSKESSKGSAVGSGDSGKSGDQDDAEELWFLNIPKDGIDDGVETKPKSKSSKSKSKKKKKKKSTDEDGEEELYFVDVPSVV